MALHSQREDGDEMSDIKTKPYDDNDTVFSHDANDSPDDDAANRDIMQMTVPQMMPPTSHTHIQT